MANKVTTTNGLNLMLLDIGLDGTTAADSVQYIEGAGDLPASLPVISFPRNDRNGIGRIWSHIRKLHLKGQQPELLGRLLTVMLHIGRESFLEASSSYVEDALWRRGCLTLVSQYVIPLGIVWEWFLEHDECSQRLGKHHSDFLNLIARQEPALIQHHAKSLSSLDQLIMFAFLLKTGQLSSDAASRFEQSFIQCIDRELQSDNKHSAKSAEILHAMLPVSDESIIKISSRIFSKIIFQILNLQEK